MSRRKPTVSSHGFKKGDIIKRSEAGLRDSKRYTTRTRAVVLERRPPGLDPDLVRIRIDPATVSKRNPPVTHRSEIWNGCWWTHANPRKKS